MKGRLDKMELKQVFVKEGIFNSRQTDTNTKFEIYQNETD